MRKKPRDKNIWTYPTLPSKKLSDEACNWMTGCSSKRFEISCNLFPERLVIGIGQLCSKVDMILNGQKFFDRWSISIQALVRWMLSLKLVQLKRETMVYKTRTFYIHTPGCRSPSYLAGGFLGVKKATQSHTVFATKPSESRKGLLLDHIS